MKKIGIITLNSLNNLGNQLQLYAMTQILSKYGTVQNIVWEDVFYEKKGNALSDAMKHLAKISLSLVMNKFKRYKSFYRCNKKHIKTFKSKVRKEKAFKKLNDKFDYFVVGSDQIWNPNFVVNKGMYVNLLAFASNEKKVAVSPSVGVEELSNEQKELFVKYLDGFENLSCREESGSKIISELTGKKVETLIDPTLMLSAEDWNKFSHKPKWHNENEKYLLVYFLGEKSALYNHLILAASKKYGIKVVNVLDRTSKYYLTNPSEFVYLIKNAEVVFTDSFHASVFSYIYEKPLKIFKRKDKIRNMNTRLENLMKTFKFNPNIYYREGQKLDDIFDVCYDKQPLLKEQEKFNKFLENSIKE